MPHFGRYLHVVALNISSDAGLIWYLCCPFEQFRLLTTTDTWESLRGCRESVADQATTLAHISPPLQSAFLAPNSMYPRETQFTNQTFFYLMTLGRGWWRKTYKPLTSKDSAEVASAFQKIYKCGPLKWPQLLQVDPGRKFMDAVTKEMAKHAR